MYIIEATNNAEDMDDSSVVIEVVIKFSAPQNDDDVELGSNESG